MCFYHLRLLTDVFVIDIVTVIDFILKMWKVEDYVYFAVGQ